MVLAKRLRSRARPAARADLPKPSGCWKSKQKASRGRPTMSLDPAAGGEASVPAVTCQPGAPKLHPLARLLQTRHWEIGPQRLHAIVLCVRVRTCVFLERGSRLPADSPRGWTPLRSIPPVPRRASPSPSKRPGLHASPHGPQPSAHPFSSRVKAFLLLVVGLQRVASSRDPAVITPYRSQTEGFGGFRVGFEDPQRWLSAQRGRFG